ncbi:MAG: hypothetical protein GDA36_09120 [Rhodobacteraceae bacterium]|nr:hypothetical protein [Paracoccaceae bacterium]
MVWCLRVEGDPVCGHRRFCSIATSASWASVLASPNYRAVLHRGIGIA